MAKGIIPTLDLAMENFHKENQKANDIRGMVTWGDEPRPIDPDTGIEYTKEEHDQNRDILSAYDFNASLWKGIDQNINLYNAYQFNADLWKAVYKHLKTSK